jgi:histone H3/H4
LKYEHRRTVRNSDMKKAASRQGDGSRCETPD